jgi:LuxR family transcriptional regulator, maltose regulon positive regulatory protein
MQKFEISENAPLPLKITPPNLRKVVSRKRLYDLINAPPHAPLIWISGPAGFGKTTLAKTFLDSVQCPFLWYKVDSRDVDLITFLHFFGRMVGAHLRNTGGMSPQFEKELPFNSKTFCEAFLSSIAEPLTIVFDNYQDAPDDSPLAAAIRTLLDQIPPGLRFIFISREEPPAFFAKYYACYGMKKIGWKDLQLSLPEAVQIAKIRGHRLPKSVTNEIFKCSKGWAAGFALLLESRRPEENLGCSEENRPRIIFDYFEELIEKISPECKEFLFNTAFLPFITQEMTEHFRSDRLPVFILDQLCNDNLFTTRIPGSEERYIYHPLFQEFLQKKAKETYTKAQLKEIWQRCGWFIAKNNPETALGFFILAEDWKSLEKLMQKYGPMLVSTGRFDLLSQLTTQIPAGTKNQLPWLLYWSAVSVMSRDPEKAREKFEKAFHLAEYAGQLEGVLLAWCGIIETIGISKKNLSDLDKWIARIEALLPMVSRFPSPEIQSQITFAMTVALVLRSRDHFEIERWTKESLCIEPGIELLVSQSHVMRQLVIHSFWMGKIEQGVHYLSRLKQRAEQPDVPPMVTLNCHLGQAAFGMFTGDYDQCLQAMSKGLQLAEENGIHGMDPFFRGYAAVSALDREEIQLAEQIEEELAAHLRNGDIKGESLSAIITARIFLLRGSPHEAIRTLGAAYRQKKLMDYPIVLGCMHLLSANAHLFAGNVNKAREHLLKARQIMVITGSEFVLFLSDMLTAQISLEQGEHEKCRSLLTMVLHRGRKLGFHYHFVDHPAATTNLLSFALKEGIEPEYVGRLIGKRRLMPNKSIVTLEEWPWQFRMRTLGRFSIEREGNPLTFHHKVPQKPLALLKLLICHGGISVPEHFLTETLWPDAEGDNAKSSFSTTLGRLRRILGDEKVLQYSDRHLTLNPDLCWVDLWSFEKELAPIRKHGSDLSMVRLRLNRLIELYRGPFLFGEKNEQDYALARERLSQKFETAVLRLVIHLEEAGHLDEAIEAYENCLERESTIESFYGNLMRCYAALGMKQNALQTFNRCQKVLSRILGVTPSQKVREMKRNIEKISRA